MMCILYIYSILIIHNVSMDRYIRSVAILSFMHGIVWFGMDDVLSRDHCSYIDYGQIVVNIGSDISPLLFYIIIPDSTVM